jgi:AGCS family alanine or glycine:cation symporter
LLALKDYEAQKRRGAKPVFNPEALGIRHAELWLEQKTPVVHSAP